MYTAIFAFLFAYFYFEPNIFLFKLLGSTRKAGVYFGTTRLSFIRASFTKIFFFGLLITIIAHYGDKNKTLDT